MHYFPCLQVLEGTRNVNFGYQRVGSVWTSVQRQCNVSFTISFISLSKTNKMYSWGLLLLHKTNLLPHLILEMETFSIFIKLNNNWGYISIQKTKAPMKTQQHGHISITWLLLYPPTFFSSVILQTYAVIISVYKMKIQPSMLLLQTHFISCRPKILAAES